MLTVTCASGRFTGRRHGVGDSVADLFDLGHWCVAEHNHELVAADAAHQVVPSYAAAQPPRNLDQDPVAGEVTQPVVDGLESVQIAEDDNAARTERQFSCEPREELTPIRQVRQRIVGCLVPQCPFGPVALGG